jgi:hypothetical protein
MKPWFRAGPFAMVVALLGLAACESIPDIRFTDEADTPTPRAHTGGTSHSHADGGSDAGAESAGACPDVAPDGGACCGDVACTDAVTSGQGGDDDDDQG